MRQLCPSSTRILCSPSRISRKSLELEFISDFCKHKAVQLLKIWFKIVIHQFDLIVCKISNKPEETIQV